MPTRSAVLCCLFAVTWASRNTHMEMLVAGDTATVGSSNLAETLANRTSTKFKPGDACDCYPRPSASEEDDGRKTKDGEEYTVEGNTCCQEPNLICEPYMNKGECRVRIGMECPNAIPIVNGLRTTYCAYGAYDEGGSSGVTCAKVEGSKTRKCCIPNYSGMAHQALANNQPIYNEPTLMAKGNQGYMESCCSGWASTLSEADGYMFESDQKIIRGVTLCMSQ
mmetsp:Transcript_69457/g.137342  ORF Transcript_69457/g.137342 Transcript_69457/m.137342 type:complete len:223 (-) Transcript_69457:69-737(-)